MTNTHDVQGRCPACRGASLILGNGGHVTCARLDCPNPTAADELLHGEQPAPGTAATEATEPGDIQITRQLGHGLIVNTAPRRARMALDVLGNSGWWGARIQGTDLVNIADQVLYRVVGYDPQGAALLLELVEDWRPAPTAAMSETDAEALKARWLETYGTPGSAHPVTVLEEQQRDQLAATLREVLTVFQPVTVNGTTAFYQATEHPVAPDDYERWSAVLNPPKEQPSA